MLEVRWSSQSRADVRAIGDYWRENDPSKLGQVLQRIRQGVRLLASGHAELGTPVRELPGSYRWTLERSFGYKIYYRLEGDHTQRIAVITIRHGRQRPLRPSTIRSRSSP